ncbi:hypothetical protein BDR07DRAFT_1417304 [Suillus spraguei]|nr:hypothetical protein BDR07DRAFT_1417304 [Suillus spraguei]
MIFRANCVCLYLRITSQTSSTIHSRPSCILMYDHLATLTDEIIFIWHRPKALCWKYMVGRQLFVFFATSHHLRIHRLKIFIILIIRTYALYNRNKYLLAWISFILIVLAGGAGAATIGQYAGNLKTSPGIGCYGAYSVESFGLACLPCLPSNCSSLPSQFVGLVKPPVFQQLRVVTRRTALDVMFQDGKLLAMALCNIPNIVLYFGVIDGNLCMATFTSCMSVTLTSRLMLNLHKSIDSGIFSIPASGRRRQPLGPYYHKN